MQTALRLAQQELTAEETRHQLQKATKDNQSRRRREEVGFYAVLSVVIAGLIVTLIIGAWAENGDTRRWAQGGFTLILGALLGSLAGYFTGRSIK